MEQDARVKPCCETTRTISDQLVAVLGNNSNIYKEMVSFLPNRLSSRRQSATCNARRSQRRMHGGWLSRQRTDGRLALANHIHTFVAGRNHPVNHIEVVHRRRRSSGKQYRPGDQVTPTISRLSRGYLSGCQGCQGWQGFSTPDLSPILRSRVYL